jgi:hypothetical protein
MTNNFPRRSTLWRGSILGGIVNAIMTAQDADYAYTQDWIDDRYALNGADGREGVIAFEGGPSCGDGRLVGVFYNVHTVREVFDTTEDEDNLEPLFLGCPSFQRKLAQEKCLAWLRIESRGRILPRVSAVFWDDGRYLDAVHSWQVLRRHGVDLIDNESIEDREAAIEAWKTEYGMTTQQISFARSVFDRKIERPEKTVELTHAESTFLESTFVDPRQKHLKVAEIIFRSAPPEVSSRIDLSWLDSVDQQKESQKAMSLCREKFAALGILVPEIKK